MKEKQGKQENNESSDNDQSSVNPQILLSVYSIGEIGAKLDLSEINDLQETLFECFDAQAEELRSAASFALGNSSVGNIDKLLPFILNHIKSNDSKKQYLLLHALKQSIIGKSLSSKGTSDLKNHFQQIVPLLLEQCDSQDEGHRNIVAECLGKLATLEPKQIIPQLSKEVHQPSRRACMATSLRYLKFHNTESEVEKESSDSSSELIEELSSTIDIFLSLLDDKDAVVRGAILQSLNYLASSVPRLISKSLPKYTNSFYDQTKIKEELIRSVDLGPFRHEVDDGLDLRKAAFQFMQTLIENCLELVDVGKYVERIASGLSDQSEIKLQCHLLIISLANVCGNSLLNHLSLLVDPLRSEIARKIDASAVSQAKNGAAELKRSALSAVAAITKIPGWENGYQKFTELVNNGIMITPILKEQFVEILSEMEK